LLENVDMDNERSEQFPQRSEQKSNGSKASFDAGKAVSVWARLKEEEIGGCPLREWKMACREGHDGVLGGRDPTAFVEILPSRPARSGEEVNREEFS